MSKEQAVHKINWPLLTVGAMMALICLGLSYWQLDRAKSKRLWMEQAEARLKVPTSLRELDLAGQDLNYRSIQVQGRFLLDNDLLLDNRIRHGMAGYERLTPFQVDGIPALLLVNRGWLPQGGNRQVLPQLPSLDSEIDIELEGYLYLLEGGLVLKQTPVASGWPKRIQRLDKVDLERMLGQPVLAYQLRLDQAIDPGLETGWTTVVVTPERHRAYALQWFLLALAIGMLSFKAAGVRRVRHERSKLPA